MTTTEYRRIIPRCHHKFIEDSLASMRDMQQYRLMRSWLAQLGWCMKRSDFPSIGVGEGLNGRL